MSAGQREFLRERERVLRIAHHKLQEVKAERDCYKRALEFCLRDLERWRAYEPENVSEMTLKAIDTARRALEGES